MGKFDKPTDRVTHFLSDGNHTLLISSLKEMKLPPSVIVPVMMVYQNTKAGKAIRYLIPDVDFSRSRSLA